MMRVYLSLLPLVVGTCCSVVVSGFLASNNVKVGKSALLLQAAPKRLPDNVEGVVYVNEKCINCAACSNFAPKIFQRNEKDSNHVVYHQPASDQEVVDARAALVGCPVAAIRVETLPQKRHRATTPEEKEKVNEMWTDKDELLVHQMTMSSKINDLEYPFPRLVNQHANSRVYYVGHHNEHSFGAIPYLIHLEESDKWIMMDTPKYSKNAMEAVEKLTGRKGPDYLVLSHVDDTADHNFWKDHYADNMKRVFHSGDLGQYNWLNDKTLEHVEILLETPQEEDSDSFYSPQFQAFTVDGKPIELPEEFWNDKSFQQNPSKNPHEAIIFHTPGHSPGSISLWIRPSANDNDDAGVLLTGDTYAYTTSNGGMATGFPAFGNNLQLQSKTLAKLLKLDWDIICPGHGHPRDYSSLPKGDRRDSSKQEEMKQAIDELLAYSG